MSMTLDIGDGNTVVACDSVIVVPEEALEEAGYIKALTIREVAHAKHEYHALAQMAYFQYQDDELEIRECEGAVVLTKDDDVIELHSGCLIARTDTGEMLVLLKGVINRKKILEAAYRYCTRWVRLDI